MARKAKHEHVNHERWLVSYADFITLLFAFFVVLYASSQADKGKMAQLSAAIQQAFSEMGTFPGQTVGPPLKEPSAPPPASSKAEDLSVQPPARIVDALSSPASTAGTTRESVEKLRRDLEAALGEELRRNEVALAVGPEGLVISLREVGFFGSGSASMRADARPAFSRIAELLKQRDCSVRLEGHTDNLPIHTSQFDSNWELSTTRATNMVRELITAYRFAPARLSAAGFAEHHPVASNATEEGRRLNRRVDIVVLQPKP